MDFQGLEFYVQAVLVISYPMVVGRNDDQAFLHVDDDAASSNVNDNLCLLAKLCIFVDDLVARAE